MFMSTAIISVGGRRQRVLLDAERITRVESVELLSVVDDVSLNTLSSAVSAAISSPASSSSCGSGGGGDLERQLFASVMRPFHAFLCKLLRYTGYSLGFTR